MVAESESTDDFNARRTTTYPASAAPPGATAPGIPKRFYPDFTPFFPVVKAPIIVLGAIKARGLQGQARPDRAGERSRLQTNVSVCR